MEDTLAEHAHAFFLEFLQAFRLRSSAEGEGNMPYYVAKVKRLVSSGRRTLWVRLRHLEEVERGPLSFEPSDLQKVINAKYASVKEGLDAAVTALVARLDGDGLLDESRVAKRYVEYAVAFSDAPPARGPLGTRMLGQLAAFRGTVLQASEARPELLFGTFRCDACGEERHGLRQEFAGGLPSRCPKRGCGSRTHWKLRDEGSATQWGDWQQLRVQLTGGEEPLQAAPRYLTAFVRTEGSSGCDSGSKVVVSGCLAALPVTSSRGQGHEFAVLGSLVSEEPGQTEAEDLQPLGRLQFEAQRPPARGRPPVEPGAGGHSLAGLASAIAPAVVGHAQAKKGLLLMLLGGVSKSSSDGCKVRGNVHVCLPGNTATGKSSLLKWVADFLPRSVYTSGRGSSASGLTAAVCRDEGSGGSLLLPGALMQAGDGVCCIDDFDLLEEGGRQSVHEVMDREEITIAKAGLHAQLNVGASVLAAFSSHALAPGLAPRPGQTARIPASIAGRFDLVLLLDGDADGTDEDFARSILAMVRGGQEPRRGQAEAAALSLADLRRRIQQGRALDPQISPDAEVRLKSCYAELRRPGAFPACGGHAGPRHLESLIRLSEATARAYLEDAVSAEHVNEAFELMTDMLRKVQWVPDAEVHPAAVARPLKRGPGGTVGPRTRRRC